MIIQVGVIGTGFGGFVHVPAFTHCEGAQVKILCGRNQAKTETVAKKYAVKNRTNRYQDILEDKDITLVTIATPPQTHKELILAAIAAGKHVLCEKPMVLNIEEASEIGQACQGKKNIYAVSHQMRFHLNHQTVKNIIDHGDLGRILHVNLVYNTANRVDRDSPWDWWSDADQGGGELNAIGSHQIDLLRWWFGEVKAVSGNLQTWTKERKDLTGTLKAVTSDDVASFEMIFENGILATCVVSSVALGWKGFGIQIYGEKAALFIDGEDQLTMFRSTSATHDIAIKDPYLTVGWVSGSIWRASFGRMARALVESIRSNQAYLGATFEDGLQIQKIIDAIRKSHDQKQWIAVHS